MHEVSIAQAVLAEVTASAETHGVKRVGRVTLRIGRLAGVVEDALRFGFEVVAENSLAEGAELVIENEPVVVWCPAGEHPLELDDVYLFCEKHLVACPELLSGRKLEIVSYDAVVAPTSGDTS